MPSRPRPVDLCRGSAWTYRVVTTAGPGPWRRTLAAAVKGHAEQRVVVVTWPRIWHLYGRHAATVAPGAGGDGRGATLPPERLRLVPDSLPADGGEVTPVTVTADATGAIDLTQHCGQERNGRWCWLLATLDLEAATDLTVHTNGDWWMQWYCDGQPVFDTVDHGNRTPLAGVAHEFTLSLSAGSHLVAVRVISGNGGWAIASQATTQVAAATATDFSVEAERRFTVADPATWQGFSFDGEVVADADRPLLNGQVIPVPLPGMHYGCVPGLPPHLVQPGVNVLSRRWEGDAAWQGARILALTSFAGSAGHARLGVAGRLLGHSQGSSRITTGPVLTHAGHDYATVSCRTDQIVALHLRGDGFDLPSPAGLVHRFRVDGLAAGRITRARLEPADGAPPLALRLRPVPRDAYRVGVHSDPSPCPEVLAKALRVLAGCQPDLGLSLGDCQSDGRNDQLWDDDYLGRNRRYFATVPHLFVLGNHDDDAPFYDAMFPTPSGRRSWAHRLGPVMWVGMDGLQDWGPDGDNARWLDTTLAGSDAPFIVALNHYPAWTSTGHGAMRADGRPVQRSVHHSRSVILPILQRHRATVYLNGHAHCYERSEPPGGVSCITTGGAGGFLYTADPSLNPHSADYLPVHHVSLFEVATTQLDLVIKDLAGTPLRRQTWTPRA